MDDVIVFLDGGYLSFISKHFGEGKPLRYKVENFAIQVAKQRDLFCKEIYFYIAPPYQSQEPTEEENTRKRNYDRFIKKLCIAKPKSNIREGRCQKTKNGFSQKGVDTLLTMDLMKTAQDKKTKSIILLTSDTDFVPIIKEIQNNYNINVILAYFTDKQRKSAFSLSNYLWAICKDKIFIKKEFFI